MMLYWVWVSVMSAMGGICVALAINLLVDILNERR